MSNITKSNIQSGERLTFYKLFSEKQFHLEIPIIQRDYAQGRDSLVEVRELFLDALYTYLEENKPNRDLDFVYGSITQNEVSRFVPLDGQQRLTTLFLLHWYLAAISDNQIELRSVLTKDSKSKFTYETRTSSREFCDALMLNDIDFKKLEEPDKGKNNSLSKTIKDRGWYYYSWENDLTIQSMLTMLDSIHQKFADKPEFYNSLIDETNPIITFLFLNLKEFKLTDDLYIKMNARGKGLSIFENFKAKFEQHIGILEWGPNLKYILKFGNEDKIVSTQEYFSYNIDTKWANLFWQYRDDTKITGSFDSQLMNFIRVIFTNQFALDYETGNNDALEYLIGTKNKGNNDDFTFYKYHEFGVLTHSAITSLINSFDNLANGNNKIQTHLRDSFFYNEEKTFIRVLQHELTFHERVQFHAYLKFLIVNNRVSEGIDHWMRVVHNLTENTIIDSIDHLENAIKSISTLLAHSENILDFLTAGTSELKFFTPRQVQEEKIKAHLINKSRVWEDAIVNIEKHPYFLGQIGFILEFSRILDYFESNKNCNWDDSQDIEFFESFKNYSDKASKVFNASGSKFNNECLWERAVLTKGDYLIHASSWRRNFLNTNRNLRDYSWKRLLRLSNFNLNDSETTAWQKRRFYVKQVFDDPNFDLNHLKESLKTICKASPNDWRNYFIKNHELIKYCEHGFIKFESSSQILLYSQYQQNHKHREMYSYNFYLKYLAEAHDFLPFKDKYYDTVKSGEDASGAVLSGLIIRRKRFKLIIYYNRLGESKPVFPFEILFYKIAGDTRMSDYPKELVKILEDAGFVWSNYGFTCYEEKERNTLNLIKNLCESLAAIES